MYGGQSFAVKFRADKTADPSIIFHIRDWFGEGENIRFLSENEKSAEVQVTVNEQAMLYWSLQFGKAVEILEPIKLRDEVGKVVKGMYEKYFGDEETVGL